MLLNEKEAGSVETPLRYRKWAKLKEVSMSAKALYDSFMQYLDVRAYVVAQEGSEIQVQENFTLRIKVTNMAPAGQYDPDVRFRNVKVNVQATEYAIPTAGNSVSLDINDSVLTRNGDSGSVDIEMRALKARFGSSDTAPDLFGPFFREMIAKISVRADVDLDAFFRIKKRVDAHEEILTN